MSESKHVVFSRFETCTRCHRMARYMHLLPDGSRLCGICSNELAYKALLTERATPKPVKLPGNSRR